MEQAVAKGRDEREKKFIICRHHGYGADQLPDSLGFTNHYFKRGGNYFAFGFKRCS